MQGILRRYSLLQSVRRSEAPRFYEPINAMAYNDKDGLVDAFDGVGDLERGVIRCVGAAVERFCRGCTSYASCSSFCIAAGIYD